MSGETPAFPVSPSPAIPAAATPAKNRSGSSAKMILGGLVGVALILLISIPLVLWFMYWRTPASADMLLRLHGSNTMGAKMIPAMAEAFLREQGAKDIQKIPGKNPEEVTIQGVLPGETSPKMIEIKAYGSDTAFKDLASAECDIGLASRKIKQEEIDKLSALGDMTSIASEHVLALDGIAVIVNKENPITKLTKDQIKQIFTGEITNWSDVDGTRGKINVFARDDKSGTYDTFKTLVLGKSPLVTGATRLEDSNELSERVASDVNGIGFIGYPYIKNSKAVAVAEGTATPLIPSRFTIATEDYLLTRRLYLYTPSNPKNTYTRKFIEFALSEKGQEVIEKEKFVSLNVQAEKPATVADAPDDYQQVTNGAERLSLNFRFQAGKTVLDNKAKRDIEVVVDILGKNKNQNQKVMLLGFADSRGKAEDNRRLSEERARSVEQEFKQRGVTPATVIGFGSLLPVASNDTEEGREKNRRVEIWLKP
jgi:phosphate transport system substrate-binding protein